MGLKEAIGRKLGAVGRNGRRFVLGGLTALMVFGAVTACQVPAATTSPTAGSVPGQTTTVAPEATATMPQLTPLSPSVSPSVNPTSTPSATVGVEPTATVLPSTTATATPEPTAVANQGNAVVVKTGPEDFRGGEKTGVQLTPTGLQLDSDRGDVSDGQYTSAVQTTAMPFNNAILSWSADAPRGTALKLELRVRVGDTWSRWYSMASWDNGQGASARGQSDVYGRVNTDTLDLDQSAQAFQYRVTMSSSQSGVTPNLRSVTVSYSDMRQPLSGQPSSLQENWARDLPVPQISQAVQDPSIRWQICSPTSLTMVLNYWGMDKSLMEVVDGVQDQTTGIYGNWPLNTAYAGTLGFDAHVARFTSVEDLQNEIAQGRPVIVSVRYGAGQISAAPLNSTSGHLIVVRGFTVDGDVIVNDPAAPSHDSVRRVYQRDQFSRVWLSSGGVAYILVPAAT